MKFRCSAAGLALCAFLAAPAMAQSSGHVDANGMPTDHSTPAEHAQTERLNRGISAANRAADAQADQNNAAYQAAQQNYHRQLEQHQRAQQRYENRTAAYESLRDRYAAERAAYHRHVWPSRWSHWTLEESDNHLIGQRVQLIGGDRVGTVRDVAHTPSGRVEALLVDLDNARTVWIDRADIRYDRADGVVMTNLDRADLHHMAESERL
jgi:hypothetical protein